MTGCQSQSGSGRLLLVRLDLLIQCLGCGRSSWCLRRCCGPPGQNKVCRWEWALDNMASCFLVLFPGVFSDVENLSHQPVAEGKCGGKQRPKPGRRLGSAREHVFTVFFTIFMFFLFSILQVFQRNASLGHLNSCSCAQLRTHDTDTKTEHDVQWCQRFPIYVS